MFESAFKYPLIIVSTLCITIMIFYISFTNPTFTAEYWTLTAYFAILTFLITLTGIVLQIIRGITVGYKGNRFYYFVAFFNLFSGISYCILFGKSISIVSILFTVLPILLGILALIDYQKIQSKE